MNKMNWKRYLLAVAVFTIVAWVGFYFYFREEVPEVEVINFPIERITQYELSQSKVLDRMTSSSIAVLKGRIVGVSGQVLVLTNHGDTLTVVLGENAVIAFYPGAGKPWEKYYGPVTVTGQGADAVITAPGILAEKAFNKEVTIVASLHQGIVEGVWLLATRY